MIFTNLNQSNRSGISRSYELPQTPRIPHNLHKSASIKHGSETIPQEEQETPKM
ncbi:hypothetical protein HanXRQr2_Chr13g0597071 [Helianthus annuus]|uniref:Uncharacterized protein n=1 Tax=Helianthus annuus TaxID=4232 RepID=A0A9K3HD70_HELAN|nr:hypothetical protein HanXRQr2_Chr13g0597071 [Helianthus annuus]KAJ0849971.1 hypothetical protein HanPSC8_Chr13g0575121 [Helianthus annuus]